MKSLRAENFFTLIIVLAGLILLLITPLGAGYDETTHVGRIWEMSRGTLIPNQYLSQGPNFPTAFHQVSYRTLVNLTPISWAEWQQQLSVHIDWDNMVPHDTRAIYFPALYLPQAFLMGMLGRVLDAPVALIYYVLRLSYLLIYAALMYFAVRSIPVGKWLLGILAIAPGAMVQASSITPDGINNAVVFAFIAWLLYLVQPQVQTLSRRQWLVTILLVLAVTMVKINSIVVLALLLLLPRKKFATRAQFMALWISVIALLLVVFVGWNVLASSQLTAISPTEKIEPLTHLMNILKNPLGFIRICALTVQAQFGRYWQEWIGVSGYGYWPMPGFVYWLYPLLLLAAVLSEKNGQLLPAKARWMLLLTYALVWVATVVIFYVAFTPTGFDLIRGIQGRYFIMAAPLLLLALVPRRVLLPGAASVAAGGAVFTLAICGLALFFAYHIPCGSSFYTPGLCYHPIYKNWSPVDAQPLAVDSSHGYVQSFSADCDQLTTLRVWGVDRNAPGAAALKIGLRDAASGQLIALERFGSAALPQPGWLEFSFEPIPASKGSAYLLEANTAGEQPAAFSLYRSPTDEYPIGALTENNAPLEGDLLFQFGCQAGFFHAK